MSIRVERGRSMEGIYVFRIPEDLERRPIPGARMAARLPRALAAWGSSHFASVLKAELESLGAGSLPLDQGVFQGGYADESGITALVMRFAGVGAVIEAKVGIFFTEVVGGYGCPIEPIERSSYCEMMVRIDRSTAETAFSLIPT